MPMPISIGPSPMKKIKFNQELMPTNIRAGFKSPNEAKCRFEKSPLPLLASLISIRPMSSENAPAMIMKTGRFTAPSTLRAAFR